MALARKPRWKEQRMDASKRGALGVLQLQNKPMMFPGNLSYPDTFTFPVIT